MIMKKLFSVFVFCTFPLLSIWTQNPIPKPAPLPEKWDDPAPKTRKASTVQLTSWKDISPDSVHKIQIVYLEYLAPTPNGNNMMKTYKDIFFVNDKYYMRHENAESFKLEKIFVRDSAAYSYYKKAKAGTSKKSFGTVLLLGGGIACLAISQSYPNYAVCGIPAILGGWIMMNKGGRKYRENIKLACNTFSHLPTSYYPSNSFHSFQATMWESAYQQHLSGKEHTLKF
jgi:hypothetical protein